MTSVRTHCLKGGYYGYMDWAMLRPTVSRQGLPGGHYTQVGFRTWLRVRE
jgi:hypothetical protein